MRKSWIGKLLIAIIIMAQLNNVVLAMSREENRSSSYELSLSLWHASKDEASVANNALTGGGKIVLEDGNFRMYVTTQELTMMGMVASILTLEVQMADGSYQEAKIEEVDVNGKPICFSFEVETIEEFYAVNVDLGFMKPSARIKVNNYQDIVIEDGREEDGGEEADLTKVENGIYEVHVALWNETSDQPSMAKESLKQIARIKIVNYVPTMFLYTQQMTMGTITASLQELKVLMGDGTYQEGIVEQVSVQGDPICFSIPLPSYEEYVHVLVNPRIAIMGNRDIGARIKVDYSSLKRVSDQTDVMVDPNPTTPPIETNKPEETTKPTETTEPEETIAPTATKKPVATSKPTATPKATATPKPTVQPSNEATIEATTEATTEPSIMGTSSDANSSEGDYVEVAEENAVEEAEVLEDEQIEQEENLEVQEQSETQTSSAAKYSIKYVKSTGTVVLNIAAGISLVALICIFIWEKSRKVQE